MEILGKGSLDVSAHQFVFLLVISTVCPRSLDPFYIESCYIELVKTSWTNAVYLMCVFGLLSTVNQN